MNRLPCIKTAVFAVLLLNLAAVRAQVYAPQPFAADFSALAKSGTNVTGKFFFSPPSTRMDMTVHGQNVSSIMNGGAKTTYVIMHAQHMYMEMKAGQASPMGPSLPQIESSFDPRNPCAASTDSTCKDLGPDTVNGRLCEKWQITPKNGNVTTTWVDQKVHFPIKSQTADGSSFELSNIKEGAQAASLFDPPADYRKMDLGGMMGGGRPPQ